MKNFDLKKNIFEDVSEFKKNHIESVIELLLYGSQAELLLQKSSMQAQIFELQEKSNINFLVKETKKIQNALKQLAETNSYEDELVIRKDMGKSWLSLESRKAELEIDLYNQLFKELNGLSNKTLPFEKFKFNDLELQKKYIQQDQTLDLKQKNIDFKQLQIENHIESVIELLLYDSEAELLLQKSSMQAQIFELQEKSNINLIVKETKKIQNALKQLAETNSYEDELAIRKDMCKSWLSLESRKAELEIDLYNQLFKELNDLSNKTLPFEKFKFNDLELQKKYIQQDQALDLKQKNIDFKQLQIENHIESVIELLLYDSETELLLQKSSMQAQIFELQEKSNINLIVKETKKIQNALKQLAETNSYEDELAIRKDMGKSWLSLESRKAELEIDLYNQLFKELNNLSNKTLPFEKFKFNDLELQKKYIQQDQALDLKQKNIDFKQLQIENHIESVIELLLYGSQAELLLQKSSMQAQIFKLQEKSNINLIVKETKKIHNALKQLAETNSYEDELVIRKDMGKSWLSLESRKAELEIDLYNQLFKELNDLSNKTLPFEKFKFNDLELHKKYIQQDQAIDLKQKNIDFKKLQIENQQGLERYIQKQFEEGFYLEENYHQDNLLEQEQTNLLFDKNHIESVIELLLYGSQAELHKKYIQQDQAIDLKQKNIDFKKLQIENQQGFERYIQKQFEEDFDLEENYHQDNLLEQEQTKVQDSNYQSCLELKLQQRKKQRQKTQNEYIENKKLKNKQILEQIQKEDAAKLQSIEEEYKSLLELKKLEDLMKKNNEDYIRATRRYREMLEQTTEKNDLFYRQVKEQQKREELEHDLEQKENLKHEQKNFINYNIM